MKLTKHDKEFQKLQNCIVGAMFDKKAQHVVSIDLRKFEMRIADMFIICNGTSDRHVEAIANFVEEQTLKKLKGKPFHKEGFENKEWILLDYFDIIVHIFLEDKRSFYSLEKLWGDGEVKFYEENDKL
jgi:ribosome-associated protein